MVEDGVDSRVVDSACEEVDMQLSEIVEYLGGGATFRVPKNSSSSQRCEEEEDVGKSCSSRR